MAKGPHFPLLLPSISFYPAKPEKTVTEANLPSTNTVP
jgi:hypothetical protein